MVIVVLSIVAILVILFVWSKSKQKSDLDSFHQLIIEADKSNTDISRQRLYEAMGRNKYYEDQFNNIRTSLYRQLAQSGDAFAQCQLGALAESDGKIGEALHWYSMSAAAGCTEAMYSLGMAYSKEGNNSGIAIGFGYDPSKSFQYYLQAAHRGHLDAMWSVAMCYGEGEGVAADPVQERFWAEKGANMGSWLCCNYLAQHIYNYSLHPMYNQEIALQWMRKSTEYADKDQFERTVREMGYIYGGSYLYNSPETPFSDRKKAAYCFTMAYITNQDDPEDDIQKYQKMGYKVSEQEFAVLRDATINRRLFF